MNQRTGRIVTVVFFVALGVGLAIYALIENRAVDLVISAISGGLAAAVSLFYFFGRSSKKDRDQH
jgi:F0F1-type ATP synthase assembly protein I